MKKTVIVLLLFIFLPLVVEAQETSRKYPYRVSLKGTSKPDKIGEFIGSGAPTGSRRYTQEGLHLTDENTQNAISGFYLKDLEIPKNYEVDISFDYIADGGIEYNGTYGEGITMFLFDADESFQLGSAGSGVGYAYNNASSNRQPGANGAYLGLTLDIHGDSKMRMNTTNVKREGVSGIAFHNYNSHITLRGGQVNNNRYKGYPVLVSQQSINASSSRDEAARVTLDPDTGDFDEDYTVDNIRPLRTAYSTGLWYMNVKLSLTPLDYGRDGTRLSTYIKHDNGFHSGSVLGTYWYYNSFKTKDQDGNVYTFNTSVPDHYKVGFAATTSQSTENHIIKDVVVALRYAPQTQDKNYSICLADPIQGDDRDNSVYVSDLFKGDRFYREVAGHPGDPQGRDTYEYVDYMSVRFEDEDGDPLDYEFRDENHGFYSISYDDPDGYGEWSVMFSEQSCKFYFYPGVRHLPEGEYSIYVSAKAREYNNGSPYGHEDYRSRPTKITVNAIACKSLVNPHQAIRVVEGEDEED